MLEAAFIARVRRMDENFCWQTRRFSAAILTDCKGKQQSMRAKMPFRRCAMAVKAASKLTLLLTDLVEHHSAEGERSFNADRLGSLASWCAKLPFLFKEDAEYEV